MSAESSEEDRANGHVDADAQGIGAADDLQEPALRELLHQEPVPRQEPRVVDPDAVTDETLQFTAERAPEALPDERVRDELLLGLGAIVHAEEILRRLCGAPLCEAHDVDRRALLLDEVVDGLLHGDLLVGERERHGPLDGADRGHGGARVLFERALEQ